MSNREFLRAPAELGLIFRRIAEIGAQPAREQRPVDDEDIVADRRRARLGPGDDAARDRRAVNGADKDEVPGERQIAEEIDRRGAAEQDAAIGDVVDAATMGGSRLQASRNRPAPKRSCS